MAGLLGCARMRRPPLAGKQQLAGGRRWTRASISKTQAPHDDAGAAMDRAAWIVE